MFFNLYSLILVFLFNNAFNGLRLFLFMIKLFVGPMFSGKSDAILAEAEKLHIANQPYILIQPSFNSRDGGKIKSRSGRELKAEVINVSEKGWLEKFSELLRKNSWIAIDEFFMFPYSREVSYSIIDIIRFYGKDRTINISSLNLDFRGEPWPITKDLFPFADVVKVCSAVCSNCGMPANRTQRFTKNKEGFWEPSDYDEPVLVVEGDKNHKYGASCKFHHLVSGQPLLKIPFTFGSGGFCT